MRGWPLLIVLLSAPCYSANLTYFWVGDGGHKLAAGKQYPLNNCSTCTIGSFWDGTTAKLSVAKNESRGIMVWMWNGSGSSATNVSVKMSSLSGPSGASIANSATLPYGDTNYSQPIQEYYTRYLPIKGESLLEWDTTITEECDLPPQFRRPYTIGGLGNCVPNAGTLWTDRPDHDQYYPDILVPYTLVAASSFTVVASSSQGVYFRVFASSTQTAGTYTGTITVMEGVSVSTTIPFQLTVYNFALPDKPTIPFIIDKSNQNITYRHYGNKFPDYNADPYYTTIKHYDQFIHMHRMIPIGDDNVSSDSPYPIDQARLSGSLYQSATGYTTAGPAIGMGDPVYSIGTYGGWQSSWNSGTSTTSASLFCTHVSNWETWFKNNSPTTLSFLYLTDEPSDLTYTNEWSTWMTTAPLCQVSGYRTNSFVTNNWTATQSGAPNLNMPATTEWIGASTTTWKAAEVNYETTGSTQAWAYNGGASYRGTMVTEDDGLGPTVIMWSAFKRVVQGWFNWESTYWTDSNDSGRDNDLWGSALTQGYDTSYDTVKGRTGYQYTNGEGVLLYPGTDVIGSTNYGFDGPMPSLRFERLTDALGDVEYLAKAKAINPTSVASTVQSIVPEVLWEHKCYDSNDCSYALGGRQWTNDPNTWETARQSVAAIITGASPSTNTSFFSGSGTISGGGVVHQ